MSRGLTQAEVLPHVDRFMGFVEKQDSGCWFRYSRARDNGYTTLQVDGRRVGAHRFSYAAFVGDIPVGMEVDHLCRDRGCVNPEHLELVDRSTNLARRDDANPGVFAARSLVERLHSRLQPSGDCFLWTGALVRGYGVVSVDGKTRYVHRVLYELERGPIPDGHDLDHLCRNPKCVNPEHLEPVTRSVNISRMLDKQPKDKCRRGHQFSEKGKTSNGTCVACLAQASGRPYAPRRTNTDTHCAKGHTYEEVGRYPAGGCRACQAEKDFARGRRKTATVNRYCEQGHDLAEVGMRAGHCQSCWDEGWCINGHDMSVVGMTASGGCAQCRVETRAKFAENAGGKTGLCPNGHDLEDVGFNRSNGQCRACAREYARKKHGYVSTAEERAERCKQGHPRTAENTRIVQRIRGGKESTEKVCRDCALERQRRYEAKKRL